MKKLAFAMIAFMTINLNAAQTGSILARSSLIGVAGGSIGSFIGYAITYERSATEDGCIRHSKWRKDAKIGQEIGGLMSSALLSGVIMRSAPAAALGIAGWGIARGGTLLCDHAYWKYRKAHLPGIENFYD